MCFTSFKHTHIPRIMFILLFSSQSFCQAEHKTLARWVSTYGKCFERGTGGGTSNTEAVAKCLIKQYVSLAFSEGLKFVMERICFISAKGWHRFSLIVSVCFAAAEPLFTATSFRTTTNSGRIYLHINHNI